MATLLNNEKPLATKQLFGSLHTPYPFSLHPLRPGLDHATKQYLSGVINAFGRFSTPLDPSENRKPNGRRESYVTPRGWRRHPSSVNPPCSLVGWCLLLMSSSWSPFWRPLVAGFATADACLYGICFELWDGYD